ncbi:MAG: Na+/H+ antiporter subunit E [Zestosphaera sp.]
MDYVGKVVGVFFLVFAVYVIFSGSTSLYDVTTGVVVALVTSVITANLTMKDPRKLLQPQRLAWLITYAFRYFFVDEVKAHVDVMKRILHPRMPINPGIVKIPYDVASDYSMLTIANSITNTPGTVVVEVDQSKKVFYVHWINTTTTEPGEARRQVSEVFERFARVIFD